MKKLILFAILGLLISIANGQTSSTLCSPYRVDKPCTTVKKSPYRINIKKPETQAHTYIRSTGPVGQVDFSKIQWKIVGDKIYQLNSIGQLDLSRPAYKLFNGKYHQVGPGGEIDFSKPSFSIE